MFEKHNINGSWMGKCKLVPWCFHVPLCHQLILQLNLLKNIVLSIYGMSIVRIRSWDRTYGFAGSNALDHSTISSPKDTAYVPFCMTQLFLYFCQTQPMFCLSQLWFLSIHAQLLLLLLDIVNVLFARHSLSSFFVKHC